MDQRLNIIFSGDGTILSKTINELEQDLKGFEAELKKTNTTDAFKGISGKIAETTQRLTQLKGATQSFSNGMRSVASGSQSATFALTNLGRVVQDAPFGFLGIANNLNPLLESFQRLKAETGSTGKALTALSSSLVGAGGLGFALSIASSLLIVFGDALFKNKEKAEEDRTAIDKLAASMATLKSNVDQYISSVEFANKLGAINVQIRGQGNLQDLREQSVANLQLIQEISENAKKANDLVTQANARVVTVENDGSSKEAIANAKQAAAEGLTALRDIQAKENKARDDQRIIFRQIALQKIKDQKELDEKQKDLNDKALEDYEKFQNEIIARARQFAKEFGNAVVVPDLADSFFKTKQEIFKASKKLLDDVSKGNLKIKIPLAVDFDLLPESFELSKDTIENFFKGVGQELEIPVNVVPDISLSKGSLDKIEEKLKLRQGFSIFGDLGFKEFNKIDFTNINAGIAEATKKLSDMLEVANTFNQAIGQGLTSAFDSAFDALAQGQNVFKALGESLKQLVIGTIKAIAQMLILKAVTNLLFPGAGGAVGALGGLFRPGGAGQVAAPSFGSIGAIGGQSAPQLVATVRGADLAFVLTQGSNQIGRVG